MYRIVEINRLDALQPLANEWADLLARTPHASFFQSLPWLTAQWRQVSEGRKLRVLLAFEGEALAGILPLNVHAESTPLGTTDLLAFPIDGWASFYGPIGADPNGILASCLEYLDRAPHDFDLIELRGLPRYEYRGETAPGYELAFDGEVAMIDLEGNWSSYWDGRKRDHNRRRNVERCERRLAELGKITYVRYRPQGVARNDADPRWDLYDACETLASKSWQAGLTNGNTLSHGAVRAFMRNAHVAAVNEGALDLNLLLVDQRPVAYVYAYHYRGYVDLIRMGFDPQLAKVAPGNALWTRLIRDSFERRDRVLDLGLTCLDYKKFWLTRVEHNYRYMHYPLNPRAQTLRLARWVKDTFTSPAAETNQRNKARVAQEASRHCDAKS